MNIKEAFEAGLREAAGIVYEVMHSDNPSANNCWGEIVKKAEKVLEMTEEEIVSKISRIDKE